MISLFLLLAGTLSLIQLPIAEFPEIALPSVQVNASYLGASSDVVEESVTQTVVHDRVLGRVRATVTVITTITALIGSILGGVIGAAFGLRIAFVIGIAGAVLATLAVWLSPAARLQRVEDAPPIGG